MPTVKHIKNGIVVIPDPKATIQSLAGWSGQCNQSCTNK